MVPVVTNGSLSPWLNEGLSARYAAYRLDELPHAIRMEARILVTTGVAGADASIMDALPALRLIAVQGAGVDAVDLDHARLRGIAVTNTPDVLTDDVADMAVLLLLSTARRAIVNDSTVRQGGWTSQPSRRVSGMRVGILGLGRIGGAIARRLEGFGCNISYHNRRPLPDCPYAYRDSPADLARECDAMIIAASGGTECLVDGAVLDALGPDGFLINIGRGSTVDETALIDALEQGRIAGAGLDVFASEPHVPTRFIALDTVVLQPHQASATIETRVAMADLVLRNIANFLANGPLDTPV
ncbi:2-hydroxyacid dehydrogenase [Sphingobium yanoikuyae]|mgnify:CR=1 FL=1|uniref:2-hydroxyacid dehydrogenase n=1 Tax=Sphingobium yanoikuyae TaxID=13690 RepID=UPI0022DCED11|nr:2-hydroxyacid dehydrogenase [Sphingobium yanoikuyae]WBQ18309.1 2-hydroxyacid dehydrogenase [Sphingobium yanoikuyae]